MFSSLNIYKLSEHLSVATYPDDWHSTVYHFICPPVYTHQHHTHSYLTAAIRVIYQPYISWFCCCCWWGRSNNEKIIKLIISSRRTRILIMASNLVSETYSRLPPAFGLYLRKNNNWLWVGTDYIGWYGIELRWVGSRWRLRWIWLSFKMRGARKQDKCKVWVEINEVVINNRFCSKFRRMAVGQFFLLCGGGSDRQLSWDWPLWVEPRQLFFFVVLWVHTLHYFEVLLSANLCHWH